MMEERIRELLYRSLDGELSPDERRDLDAALAGSPGLRREREDLLTMRGLVKDGAARSFGPFFAERVMNTISSEREEEAVGARFFESLLYTFRRVVRVAAAVVAFLLIYNLNQGGSVSVASAFGTEGEATIEEVLTAPVEETLEELL
jgi:anti-sigma factor RsiW